MTIQEAVRSVLNQYATFSGRARRSEYWYFFLCSSLVSWLLGVVGQFIGGTHTANFLTSLFSIAIFVPSLAVMWRRLHDTGRSGLSILFLLIPLVGWIILLVFLCQDSQPGTNAYGPNPKDIVEIW